MNLPPSWFNTPEEQELGERLEYEKIQLEMLKMDVANTELRIANLEGQMNEKEDT